MSQSELLFMYQRDKNGEIIVVYLPCLSNFVVNLSIMQVYK